MTKQISPGISSPLRPLQRPHLAALPLFSPLTVRPVSPCPQALHDEVKSHQRIVSGVCRLCVQLAEEGGRRRLVRVAERLDTSWQQIYLRAYEWTCHLEGLLEQFKQVSLRQPWGSIRDKEDNVLSYEL